jgi:hypothetical protein
MAELPRDPRSRNKDRHHLDLVCLIAGFATYANSIATSLENRHGQTVQTDQQLRG